MTVIERIDRNLGIIIRGINTGKVVQITSWDRWLRLSGNIYMALWPLSKFDLVYNFAESYYRENNKEYSNLINTPNTTFTRATTAIVSDADGTLREIASGEPAIGRGRGMGFWPAIQNKCTNFNAAPTDLTNIALAVNAANGLATFTLVSDVAAIQAAPELAALYSQGVLNGNVYKLDNSLGDSVARVQVSGATGNTGVNPVQVWWRGTGTATIGHTGTAGTNISLPATYTRRAEVLTSSNTAQVWALRALPGAVVYFILNSLTETAYVPPAIAVAGAASTRNSDEHRKTSLTPNPAGFAIYDEGEFRNTAQGSVAVSIDDNTNQNRVDLWSNSVGNVQGRIINAGVASITGTTPIVAGQKVKSIVRWNGDNTFDCFVNGAKQGGLSSSLPSGLNRLVLGRSAVVNTERKGVQAVFAIRNRPGLTDAECIALTTL